MRAIHELKRLQSLEQGMSSSSAVKENNGDLLSTSSAALSPSSPKLETEPPMNQVSSLRYMESQFI